ncbi:MAG: HAMP domain-containing histidine kinase [bacterium]|nr:HAMP domain-containing histidine kinase [bacterium]
MPNTVEAGRALAAMAHDIKAPLTAVVSLLDLIIKGYVTDIDKAKEISGRAAQKAGLLIEMLDDIMDYTLLANKSMMRVEKIDACAVLAESINMMKPYADEKHIDLSPRTQCSEEKYVTGNYTFLLRVFNNLIMNAVKYNKKDGKIECDCIEVEGKDSVAISVSDTGIGVPDDEKERIFKIFERGKYARKNVNGCLGLGLSLVKRIVDEHHGSIDLTDTQEGVGTTFTVTLPLLIEEGGTNESKDFSS